MASISARRLAKELREIQGEGCPVGITLLEASDFSKWLFTIEVMGESLYQNEKYVLQFRFDAQYPISSPAVQFVVGEGKEAPIHPHVYSNGHICASILGNEWSPVLNVVAVCVTLQSMLASCKKKERPVDNDRYVRTAPDNPKKTVFHYDGELLSDTRNDDI
ncbi:ubiquitin conjugating enzyme [Panaeolus papilionaceus]|nr:ubiquitin conjugating enzyme [Panaeolus papilionaceus]